MLDDMRTLPKFNFKAGYNIMIRTVKVLIVVICVYGRNGEVLQERPIQIRHVITLKVHQ